ncbi:MAG: DUF2934 domain-containing protein [Myxacorys chilensis ATA2-1-KO14]|nr:DUF2934 domain-containing protein [Myxacorys chilensis ATA2-1-KO14]
MQKLKRRALKSKPLSFTEEQISAKSYEIWEKRGHQGTPEENWQAAIAALRQERLPLWKLRQLLCLPFRLLARLLLFLGRLPGNVIHLLRLALTAETPDTASDVVKTVISAYLRMRDLNGFLFSGFKHGSRNLITLAWIVGSF